MSVVHYDADYCIMTKFSSLISGKWKPILLHLVETNVNRFSLMTRQMPTISRKILTEQLRELEADGLIYRDELKAKAPKVVVYHLTEKGRSLRILIDEMIKWSMKYMEKDIPVELVDAFVQSQSHLSDRWTERTPK